MASKTATNLNIIHMALPLRVQILEYNLDLWSQDNELSRAGMGYIANNEK